MVLKGVKINQPKLRLRAPSQKMRRGVAVVALLGLCLVSGFSGAWLESRADEQGAAGNIRAEKRVINSQSQLISHIARTVGPSVVSVNVAINASGEDFGIFGFSGPRTAQAAGTGIIVSGNGLVITNRHVVPEGTSRISLTLSDGTELKNVSVIGRTSDNDNLDIAFLKINDTNSHKLTPAALGNSSVVQVGDSVVAIGNALGQFQNTVTSGIISGYGRSVQAGDSSGGGVENLDDLFQTDAAINEGNSGGPLVNLDGQVIGINTAIAGGAQNIGFAIPINDVQGLIKQVVKTGKFARPYLGVRYIPLTADIAAEFDLRVSRGAFIPPSSNPASPSVIPNGPAAKAGLQENDIITAINGTNIDQRHSLISLLTPHQPGDKLKVTVLRGETIKHFTVTLDALPSN